MDIAAIFEQSVLLPRARKDQSRTEAIRKSPQLASEFLPNSLKQRQDLISETTVKSSDAVVINLSNASAALSSQPGTYNARGAVRSSSDESAPKKKATVEAETKPTSLDSRLELAELSFRNTLDVLA